MNISVKHHGNCDHTASSAFKYSLFCILVVFFLFLFYLTPMSSDDVNFWALRITDFNDILDFSLSYGNGRFLGNLGVMYLIEYSWLRVVVKSLVCALITSLLPHLLDIKTRIGYIFSALLVICVSPEIFSQVFSWTSGFQNYVPSLALMILGLHLVKISCSAKGISVVLFSTVAFLIGVSMQLYVEHSTVINLVFLLCILIYLVLKHKSVSPALASFIVGAVIGAALIFLIPKLFSGTDNYVSGYRNTVFSGGIMQLAAGIVRNSLKLICMYSENILALTVLAFSQTFLVFKNKRIFGKFSKIIVLALTVPASVIVFYHLIGFNFWYGRLAVAETLLLAFSSLVLICAVIISGFKILFSLKTPRLSLAYVMFAFSLFSVMPLIFVEPIWPRCMFHSYLFLVAADIILLDEIVPQLNFKNVLWHIYNGTKTALLVAMLSLLILFMDISKMENIRENYIAEQIDSGNNSVDYFALPTDYIYDYWQKDCYEEYYSVKHNTNVEVNILPAEVWFDNYYFYK